MRIHCFLLGKWQVKYSLSDSDERNLHALARVLPSVFKSVPEKALTLELIDSVVVVALADYTRYL